MEEKQRKPLRINTAGEGVSKSVSYINSIIAILFLFCTSATTFAEEKSDNSLSLYASLVNYSAVSEKAKVLQKNKPEANAPVLETELKIKRYSLKDEKFIFPDTPVGNFFEDLAIKTESQIKNAEDDILYCRNNLKCNYELSREHGTAFRAAVLNSLFLVLTKENTTVRYAFEKVNSIESYFTAYYDPDDNKMNNPILSHFKSRVERTENEVTRDRSSVKFVLDYKINKGLIGKVTIPSNIIYICIGHEIDRNKTRGIMKFPSHDNVWFEVVRQTDNEYLGTVQMNLPTKNLEELILNFLNPNQAIL